ncbi:MAG: DUF4097 family beta strand repeat-containing protein [Candidatus Aminicenantales bacterium]
MINKMTKASLLFMSIMAGLWVFIAAHPNDGQKTQMDRVTVPLSKPGQSVSVHASSMTGAIKVEGTEGQEVIIETYAQGEQSTERGREPKRKTEGLRLIVPRNSGLEVEEENNVVHINLGPEGQGQDLFIKVPRQCSLELSSSEGDIVVENVSGNLEVESSDGSLTLTGISGSVVASSGDGDITVVLNAATPGKPMSFSTVDGDIDVTLPADIKATVKLKTEEGNIYTDFGVDLQQAQEKKENKEGGKYRLEVERFLSGTINGGGQEYKFTCLEGDIYLRKKK